MECAFCGEDDAEIITCDHCRKILCEECMFADPIEDDSVSDYERYPHDGNCMPIKCDCGHIAYIHDGMFHPMDGDQCGIDELYDVYNREDAIREWKDYCYRKEAYWICGFGDCLRISCPNKECVNKLLQHKHNHQIFQLMLVGKRDKSLSLLKDLYKLIRQLLVDEDLYDRKGYYDTGDDSEDDPENELDIIPSIQLPLNYNLQLGE